VQPVPQAWLLEWLARDRARPAQQARAMQVQAASRVHLPRSQVRAELQVVQRAQQELQVRVEAPVRRVLPEQQCPMRGGLLRSA
jgi:hypothetical protein